MVLNICPGCTGRTIRPMAEREAGTGMNREEHLERIWLLIFTTMRRLWPRIEMNLDVQMTGPQYFILALLDECERCKVSDLAESLSVTPSAVTGMIDRLYARGSSRGREAPMIAVSSLSRSPTTANVRSTHVNGSDERRSRVGFRSSIPTSSSSWPGSSRRSPAPSTWSKRSLRDAHHPVVD